MSSSTNVESYCRSIAENAIGSSASDSTKNSTNWSPNNVRRLFLSPDGVAVQFFTHTSLSKKPFSQKSFTECVASPKYKPMIGVLAGAGSSYVCSNVEEVIICLKSVNSNLSLHNKESDYKNLIDNSSNVSDIKTAIQKRFGRLRAVVYLNITMNELIRGTAKNLNNLKYFVFEDSNLKSFVVQIHSLDNSTWYESISLRPKFYKFDAPDSLLSRQLNNFKGVMVDEKKDEAKKSINADVKEKCLEKWNKALDNFILNSKALLAVYGRVMKKDKLGLLGANLGINAEFGLSGKKVLAPKESDRLKELNSIVSKLGGVSCETIEVGTGSSDITNNFNNATNSLNEISACIYEKLFKFYVAVLEKLQADYRVTLKLVMNMCSDIEVREIPNVPKGNIGVGVKTLKDSGVSLSRSLVNIGAFVDIIYRDETNFDTVKEKWKKALEGGVSNGTK